MAGDEHVVAVVQARLGSTRLPGKMLACLGGMPVIEQVLVRTGRAALPANVVLATTERDHDAALCRIADDLGVPWFRGSEEDVLGRVYLAAEAYDANIVVRACADNPLVDPEEIDRAIRHHKQTGADYTFNHIPSMGNGYPNGLGVEVIDAMVLSSVADKAEKKRHREHVTSYIWDNRDDFSIEAVQAPPSIRGEDVTLDLDDADDFAALRELYEHAPQDVTAWKASDIVDIYKTHRHS